MGLMVASPRGGGIRLRPLDPYDPALLAIAILVGLALVVFTTPLGSGDYGQWLMTARPYGGLSVPEYRAAASVPPVVPLVLGVLVDLLGDALVAIRLFTVVILLGLGASAYVAAATLFRSRIAGLLATVLALLVVDQFLDLFAFGGLLQASAIVFAWLAVAAFFRAAHASQPAWGWWIVGAGCVGLTGLTHMGTAYILVPTGCAVAVIAARHAVPGRGERLARLAPLGVVLIGTMVFWLLVLLPGSTDLIRNPASLDYRGPDRLLESLSGHWPTAAVAIIGLGAIAAGTLLEIRRRLHGAWIMLATWTAITLAVLGIAVVTRAATDYPRFAAPVLAPLILGAAGILAAAVLAASRWLTFRTRRGTVGGWSTAVLGATVLLWIPLAADRFITESHGYQLRAAESLGQAAAWIDTHLPPQATVLAPVREAKWLEGLTGRPALFSNAFRYSFRAVEWERSLAADTLLRSSGALVNPYFFARLTAPGADQSVPRGLVIAANHGGEYVDLLATAPDRARILSPDPGQPVLASLTNLGLAERQVSGSPTELRVATTWMGERRGALVTYRQVLQLQRDSSVLDLRVAVETTLPTAGLELELHPVVGPRTAVISVDGREATLSFTQMGSREPRLRVVLVGAEGVLRETAAGGLRVESPATEFRLLITDLTAAGVPAEAGGGPLQWLDPVELIDRYGVEAVLLARDPTIAARQARVEALGFSMARDFGPYLLFARR